MVTKQNLEPHTLPDGEGRAASPVQRALRAIELLAVGALVTLLDPEDPPINTGFLAQRAGAPARRPVTLVRDVLLRAARSW
ncbi:hypothetical protein [Nonomuraea terrae]|uniref:hypothetical protein n=1 Tax=Nonomuraea terrae TaxID=2530383 RepID=UPI001CB71A5A|nr:hypothetical protein [Nonomuraea terrae]